MANIFTGSSGRTEQVNRFNPQQMQQQAAAGQLGLQGIQNTSMDFNKVRPRIMREFQTNTVPGLLERLQGFQGAGVGNSSALGQQLGGALENLGENLYGQEQQFNLQKFQNLLQAFQQGQQSPWDTIQHAAQPGLLNYLAGGAGQALGSAAMGGGNPMSMLSSLLSMFGGGNKTQSSTGGSMGGGAPVSNMGGSTQPYSPGFSQQAPGFNARSLYRATSAFPMGMQNFF